MGLLGTSAQAFTDNFLKTYMAIGEDRRAEASQKIAQQMAQAKIAEMQQQEAIRQAQIREIQAQAAQRENAVQQDASMYQDMANLPVQVNMKGLMSSGIIDPKTQSSDPRALQQIAIGQMPTGYNVGLLGAPTTQDQLNVLTKYNPEKALSIRAQMENTASNNEMRLALEQLRQEGANRRQDIKIHVGGGGDGYSKEERDIVKPIFSKMPELQKNAREAVFKIDQYKQLSNMLERGAGGIEGGLKAALAPIAEYMGVDSKGMSEAQAYQLIARAGAGSMRLQLIGPGQVSEYEQKLIQKLSGGDIRISREAARDLFRFYSAQSRQSITNYNDSVDSLVKAGYSKIGDVYKKIDTGAAKDTATTSRDITSGVSYLKQSKNRDDAKARIRALSSKGWSKDELNQIASQAGW